MDQENAHWVDYSTNGDNKSQILDTIPFIIWNKCAQSNKDAIMILHILSYSRNLSLCPRILKLFEHFPFFSTYLSEDYTCTGIAGSFLLRFKLLNHRIWVQKEFQSQ